jgi:hypothetical protein
MHQENAVGVKWLGDYIWDDRNQKPTEQLTTHFLNKFDNA